MVYQDEILILLVEDNPADVELTKEAFSSAKIKVKIINCIDGDEALAYLHQYPPFENAVKPDLILLDLNLPRTNGHEVMRDIFKYDELRSIPLVVLTTSDDEQDIKESYAECANCYVTKPVDFPKFLHIIKSIEGFWLSVVKLPK